MRPIHSIAQDIETHWKKPYFGAVPYLRAMRQIRTIDDNYGMDSADMIVRYFLSNASTFRGEQARKLKSELKEML